RALLSRARSLARDCSQRAGRFPDSHRTALAPAALSDDSGGEPREAQPTKRDHALDHVLELPNIAREAVLLQALDYLCRERKRLALKESRVASDEVVRQGGNVLRAFAEWRHIDSDDVQPVEELLAKIPLGDSGF